MINTPVYIFSGERTLPIACIQRQALLSEGFEDVTIVCPRRLAAQAEAEAGHRLAIRADEDVAGYSELENDVGNLPEKIRWYKQQFLKMLVAKNADSDVVILDGDTIFRPSVVLEMVKGSLYVSNEDVTRYRSFNKLLELPTFDFDRSFVTNGIFIPESVSRVLDLELCRRVVQQKKRCTDLDFSEYQLVGSLRLAICRGAQIKPIRLFRRADLLSLSREQYLPKLMQSRYDAVAFEYGHTRSLLRETAAKILFRLGYSW